jgi:hypothetical protein
MYLRLSQRYGADMLGKYISNTAQWMMILYAANPNMIISPPVVLAFGTIAFLFSELEAAIDFWEAAEAGRRG